MSSFHRQLNQHEEENLSMPLDSQNGINESSQSNIPSPGPEVSDDHLFYDCNNEHIFRNYKNNCVLLMRHVSNSKDCFPCNETCNNDQQVDEDDTCMDDTTEGMLSGLPGKEVSTLHVTRTFAVNSHDNE